MKTTAPVSMRDVALRAGVTASTVSLCLRESPSIPPPTRARVLAAAQELGYRMNPFVSALMRSRRQRGAAPGGPALAFVTAFPTRDGWRKLGTPVFAQMFEGARLCAERRGYELQEFWLHEQDMSLQRFANILLARGIRGLVIAPLPNPNGELALPWDNFAAVALGTTLVRPGLHRVANDLFHSMLIAMEECHRLGYRRIGLALRLSVNQKVQRRWLAAYLVARAELPGLVQLDPLLAEPICEDDFFAWIERERPEVIIESAPNDGRRWLQARGWRIPGEIGIVSLSSPGAGEEQSGIVQNAGQIGLRAVDLLVSLLEHNEYGVPRLADTLLVDGSWNPGRTLRAAPAGAAASLTTASSHGP